MLSEKLELQVTPTAAKALCNTTHKTAKVLIQLTNLLELEATSEPVETIVKQFPSFALRTR